VAAWFVCTILIIFIVLGVAIAWKFLLSVLGAVHVVCSGSQGRIRTGIGPFKRTRRFDISTVKNVREESTAYYILGRKLKYVRIDAEPPIRFGLMLSTERRGWMQRVLHKRLLGDRGIGKKL
jgi:hypothetical protein